MILNIIDQLQTKEVPMKKLRSAVAMTCTALGLLSVTTATVNAAPRQQVADRYCAVLVSK
jgi:hypothetical protein